MIDCGRFAAKRTVGESRAGRRRHLQRRPRRRARGRALLRAGLQALAGAPLRHVDAHVAGDRWAGEFEVTRLGPYTWTVEAWIDAFAGWREELRRKLEAGQADLSGELSEGVLLLDAGGAAREGRRRDAHRRRARGRCAPARADEAHQAALDPDLLEAVQRHPDRSRATPMDRTLRVDVDRERARFGAWYELFPRSWGGLKGVAKVVPELAELGFDVLYLPPIHPIGLTNRKGANNTLTPRAGDPGSPWAIGDA